MHDTIVERHVDANKTVWRVRCMQCGIVDDHIETDEIAEFLVALHRGTPSYVRAAQPTGRSHVLDVDTDETLCGIQSQWGHTDSHPDLASCLSCWTAWELRAGTSLQHSAGLTAHPRLLARPYCRKGDASDGYRDIA